MLVQPNTIKQKKCQKMCLLYKKKKEVQCFKCHKKPQKHHHVEKTCDRKRWRAAIWFDEWSWDWDRRKEQWYSIKQGNTPRSIMMNWSMSCFFNNDLIYATEEANKHKESCFDSQRYQGKNCKVQG